MSAVLLWGFVALTGFSIGLGYVPAFWAAAAGAAAGVLAWAYRFVAPDGGV